mmetsp:Transcript_19557/g.31485  ORF Transcript_19557/g.31485 Transcript_19557/m.31485 type:complete len:153 (+) Transcript_19557:101-559(+)
MTNLVICIYSIVSKCPRQKNGEALTREELTELSRLLTKLQGTSHKLLHSKKHTKKSHKDTQDNEKEEEHTHYQLQVAKASDFGTASGEIQWEDDDEEDGFHGDHGDDFFPFASSCSSGGFFGGSRGFYFGGNFGTNPYGGDNEDGNVQCQQM